MILFHRLRSMLSWLIRRDRAERLLDDELRTFVEMAATDKQYSDLSAAEARRLALIELGGVEQVKERVRSARPGAVLDDVARDVRYALRLFARQPVFALVIILTLGLGIGANTAIFSIIDSLLLRTLPIRTPERLARLVDSPPSGQTTWTFPIWHEIERHADRFDGAFAWSQFDARFNMASGGEAQYAVGVWASANSFDVLGIRPAAGRLFMASDDTRGGGPGGPVVVISHAFWQQHFGGAPDAIGRTLTLERVPLTVIGVTPPGFFGLSVGRTFDVVLPLGAEPLIRGKESRLDRRTSWWLPILIRLKPGQSLENASAAMQAVQPAIREATLPPAQPGERRSRYLSSPFRFVGAATGISGLRKDYGGPLTIIMVVVGLVLLIACANIANLLLARATARSHEWSIRLALGASRGRLARQLLIESLLLAAAGAAAGVLIAQWSSQLLVRQLSADAVYLELPLDWRVLAFTAGVALAAALLSGVAPAIRAAHGAPIDAMKERGRHQISLNRAKVANGLVLAQVILSVVLVVCAGLFLRSFGRLTRVPLGFDSERLLIAEMDMRHSDVAPEARMAAYERIRQRVRAVPGIEQTGVSVLAPFGAMWSRRIEVSGSPLGTGAFVDGPEGYGFNDRPIPDSAPLAVFNGITPGWMATYGTPLLAGRDISERDDLAAPPVALVNESFARKFLNGANPVGHTMRFTKLPGSRPAEIVGLVANAVYRDVHEATLPTAYVPFSQSSDESRTGEPVAAPAIAILTVRAASSRPALLTKSVAAAVGDVNPTIALTFDSMESLAAEVVTRERLLAILSGSFGALALLMAAVGLYGVTSYTVNLRRTEIGIRMALGATRASIVRLILGRLSWLIGGGIGVGLLIAAWASRFVATLLFGLQPTDVVTLLAAAVTLAVVGTLAGWLPAVRASRQDPTSVLNEI